MSVVQAFGCSGTKVTAVNTHPLRNILVVDSFLSRVCCETDMHVAANCSTVVEPSCCSRMACRACRACRAWCAMPSFCGYAPPRLAASLWCHLGCRGIPEVDAWMMRGVLVAYLVAPASVLISRFPRTTGHPCLPRLPCAYSWCGLRHHTQLRLGKISA